MTGRRVALRLALRRMRRDRRRTLILLTALVIPLMVAVALSTLRVTSQLSPEDKVASMIGQSESVVLNGSLVREQGPERALTSGGEELSRAAGKPVDSAVEVTGSLPVRAGELQVDSFGYGLDADDPVHRGRFTVLRGTAPRSDNEIGLSDSVAQRLGVSVGDQVQVGRGTTPVTVTAVMVVVTDTLRKFVVTTPLTAVRNAPAADASPQGGGLVPEQDNLLLVWHTPAALDPDAMRVKGWTVNDRLTELRNVEGSQDDETTAWILGIAALIIAELGLVLGAVYTIVVRSNRRELGLLASAGAGPKVRRAVIVYQGMAVGAVALVISTVLGMTAAFFIAPEAAARSFQLWGPVRPDPLALAVLAILGIGTPALAARIAARGVATDVVAALRDQAEPARSGPRRGLATLAGVLPLSALLLFSGGLFKEPLLVLIGALALVAGAGYVLRQVLPGISTRAERLPLLHRIGLRLTARAAPRAAALGTVVASLIAIAGLILAAMGGLTNQVNETYIANTPSGSGYAYATDKPSATTVRALAEAFGAERIVRLGVVSPPPPKNPPDGGGTPRYWGSYEARTPVADCLEGAGGTPREPVECLQVTGFPAERSQLMAVDAPDLDAVLGRAATPAERDGLAQGKALVLDERLAPGGIVTVHAPDPNADRAQRNRSDLSARLPALVAQQRATYSNMPTVIVSSAAVSKIGAVIQPNDTHLYVPNTGQPITEEQEDRANAILAADIGQGTFLVQVERGPTAGKVLRSTTIASIVLLVLAAAALAFITVALATQEMRPDLSALAAAGADRRFRSLLSGSHAGQVTLLGVLVGVGVTVVATPALLASLDVGWSVWSWLGLLASGIAAISAAVLAGWFGGSRVTTLLKQAN